MSLWSPVCSVHLCSLWEKEHFWESLGRFFSHRRYSFLSWWTFFSLTERTEFTEHFCAQFRAHRTPPAYRVHRALLPKVAVRFCEISWLNVSVECCVFCSSVFFCEKLNAPTVRERILVVRWGVLSLTLDIFISHRAYRVHGVSCVLFWVHKEGVHLLLMLIFNLLRPSLWVLFSVQIH